jgi:hypothetical protein
MALKYYVYARLLVTDGVKSTNSGFVQKTAGEQRKDKRNAAHSNDSTDTKRGEGIRGRTARTSYATTPIIYPLYVRHSQEHTATDLE